MTLGNMRSLGPRSLDTTCTACGYYSAVNVNAAAHNPAFLPFFTP
jgi:hypothetical protein